MEHKKNEEKSITLAGMLRFILLALIALSLLIGTILYFVANISGINLFASWWVSSLFACIGLCGVPIVLMIDGIVGSLYEAWGKPETKEIFLFYSKTLEALTFVFIVHQADQWLKDVTSSIWMNTIIGYGFFLLVEGTFLVGKR